MPVAETLTTATKLSKDTTRVLDDAAKGPVTLFRSKKPAITLVERDAWCDATQAKHWLSVVSVVVLYTLGRIKGEEAGYPAEYAWLRRFSNDELRDFINEITGAVSGALHTGRSWDGVDAVVEEWRRSAALLEDDELNSRFKQTLGDIRR